MLNSSHEICLECSLSVAPARSVKVPDPSQSGSRVPEQYSFPLFALLGASPIFLFHSSAPLDTSPVMPCLHCRDIAWDKICVPAYNTIHGNRWCCQGNVTPCDRFLDVLPENITDWGSEASGNWYQCDTRMKDWGEMMLAGRQAQSSECSGTATGIRPRFGFRAGLGLGLGLGVVVGVELRSMVRTRLQLALGLVLWFGLIGLMVEAGIKGPADA